MDFTTLVQKRHSTRAFTDQVIPRSQLDQVIQDALTTPSWVNSQPWRVYVATGKTLALIKENTVKQSTKAISANQNILF